MRETQVAYAEALEPTLIKLEVMKTTAIKTLGSFQVNIKLYEGVVGTLKLEVISE